MDNSAALRVHGDEDDLAGITRAARDGSTLTGLTGRYSPSVARSDGGAAVADLVDKVKTGTEAISVLMLAIAVLGILNIGFASVRERSEELTLGVRLAPRRPESQKSDVFFHTWPSS